MSEERSQQIPAHQAIEPHAPEAPGPPPSLNGRDVTEAIFWRAEQVAQWLDGVQSIADEFAKHDAASWAGAPDPNLRFE